MNILKTRLYSQETNSEKLYEFSNTIFYRRQMKQDFIPHPIGSQCRLTELY